MYVNLDDLSSRSIMVTSGRSEGTQNSSSSDETYLTCWLLMRGGMGSSDGAQGRRSRGEPVNHDVALPSPALFHTKAVGQSRVIACKNNVMLQVCSPVLNRI